MNPSNPTATEMQQIEALFFEQMKRQTRLATDPVLMSRMLRRAPLSWQKNSRRNEFLLRSFDFQFSDRWITS